MLLRICGDRNYTYLQIHNREKGDYSAEEDRNAKIFIKVYF